MRRGLAARRSGITRNSWIHVLYSFRARDGIDAKDQAVAKAQAGAASRARAEAIAEASTSAGIRIKADVAAKVKTENIATAKDVAVARV